MQYLAEHEKRRYTAIYDGKKHDWSIQRVNNRAIVESYIPMAKFIAAICGSRCEVALHYLAIEDMAHSLIAIENGHITGRKVGDGLMNFALDNVMDDVKAGLPYSINLPGIDKVNGKHLRYMSYYIRNEKQQFIGVMNVTFDVSQLLQLQQILNESLFYPGNTNMDTEPASQPLSATDMVQSSFDSAIKQLGFSSTENLKKNDKLKVIGILHEHNLFLLRGTVSLVAKLLKISEPSVYRYIHELNNTNGSI